MRYSVNSTLPATTVQPAVEVSGTPRWMPPGSRTRRLHYLRGYYCKKEYFEYFPSRRNSGKAIKLPVKSWTVKSQIGIYPGIYH